MKHITLRLFTVMRASDRMDEGQSVMTQQQLEELECMLNMFPNEEELVVDLAAKSAHETFLMNDHRTTTLPRIQYTLCYKDLPFDREIPSLTLICPHGYPETMSMLFEVKCPQLSRVELKRLSFELQELATAACTTHQVVGLQLYQHMHDFLSRVESIHDDCERNSASEGNAVNTLTPMVVGRRAIYFHHIIALTKRRVVKEWALELHLGGFCKIGWPGVIIVEGLEDNVQEYIRRLQHLRWKQMTVRGEQTEVLKERNAEEANLLWRRLPRHMQELPENGMSDLAAACRAGGLEELFLTTMKIYGRSEDKESDMSASFTRNTKRDNKKDKTLQ